MPNKLIVNFESKGINALEFVSKVQELNSNNKHGLFIDSTSDKNIIYTGAEPINYVEFGNDGELWRIIGIFNVTDSNGKLAKKIKLVRNEKLGNYSWDSSESSKNLGRGFNDWTTSDLKAKLNGDYLDPSKTGTTTWYNGQSNSKNGIFDYTNSIRYNYKNMIDEVVWNLGGWNAISGVGVRTQIMHGLL